ncbi:hypothetical protein GmRootV118_55840 [Variovorax sp. V118]|uniref:tyrosine-type recombinase/integrase n=1 Tax=Variovorax sp. V118 TaxID=3065954 RepID=UPI0034E8DE10
MALTDTFVRQVKHKGAEIGERYADGGGMYLRVKAAGKYWRLDYRIDGKSKTLGLGVYPDVSLLQARERRDATRKLLASGIDPSAAKREEKKARADAAANTFEAVAREWLAKTAAKRADGTQLKVKTWLEKDVFPFIGKMPMSTIGRRDILERVVRKLALEDGDVVIVIKQALLLFQEQPMLWGTAAFDAGNVSTCDFR